MIVAVKIDADRPARFAGAIGAVVYLLRQHCTPAECQWLKLEGLRDIQRSFPVESHDAGELRPVAANGEGG